MGDRNNRVEMEAARFKAEMGGGVLLAAVAMTWPQAPMFVALILWLGAGALLYSAYRDWRSQNATAHPNKGFRMLGEGLMIAGVVIFLVGAAVRFWPFDTASVQPGPQSNVVASSSGDEGQDSSGSADPSENAKGVRAFMKLGKVEDSTFRHFNIDGLPADKSFIDAGEGKGNTFEDITVRHASEIKQDILIEGNNTGIISTGPNASNTIINKSPQRTLNENLKRDFLAKTPKDRKIMVNFAASNNEAMQFAKEIRDFLAANGYNVELAAMMMPEMPPLGIDTSGEQIEIYVGSVE